MGKTLSMDLRERVVAAYERGEGGYVALAQLFGIGSATLKRLVRRKRARGTLEPDPAPNGFPPLISGPRLRSLKLLVEKHPDATTMELTAIGRRQLLLPGDDNYFSPVEGAVSSSLL